MCFVAEEYQIKETRENSPFSLWCDDPCGTPQ